MNDLISRQDAIDVLEERLRANGYSNVGLVSELNRSIGYLMRLPSAEPKTDEESELRFYYVESIDDYWIGQRLDNFYYADWHKDLGFVWSKSRYLLWGEHIVDENTLWKEHTYPSEPIEIPFCETEIYGMTTDVTTKNVSHGCRCPSRMKQVSNTRHCNGFKGFLGFLKVEKQVTRRTND